MALPGAQTRTLSPFTGKPGWQESKDARGNFIGFCPETDSRIIAEDEEGLVIAYNLAVARREGRGDGAPTVTTEVIN